MVDSSRYEPGTMPPVVEDFLVDLYTGVVDRDHCLVKRIYEVDFQVISEKQYNNERWPCETTVASFYTSRDMMHDVIISLYRELYYRHVFSKNTLEIPLGWNDRFMSSINYERLLEYFLLEECAPSAVLQSPITIPPSWLWNMFDEFVYQYCETQRWKAHYAKEFSTSEIAMQAMQKGSTAWRCTHVCHLLHSIVDETNVVEIMAGGRQSNNVEDCQEGDLRLYLGVFASVGLLRLYTSMGAYRLALLAVDGFDLTPTGVQWQFPLCNLTLVYHVGFCYMMMRRYQDACRVLSVVLFYIIRNRQYVSGYEAAAMSKVLERINCTLMLCVSLVGPRTVDETLVQSLQDKNPDMFAKLQGGDEVAFRETFIEACPRFVNPFVSNYEDPEEFADWDVNEPLQRQLRTFMKDVSHQSNVFNVRSVAKLYTNLSVSKLASLMGHDPLDKQALGNIRADMLSVKAHNYQVLGRSHSHSLLQGSKTLSSTEVDIYLERDQIYVISTSSKQSYIETFIKQNARAQEVIGSVSQKVAYSRPVST